MTARKMVLEAALLGGAMIAAGADVSYSAKPETEPIVVAAGDSAETLGVRALRSQIYHWTFDDPDDPLTDEIGGVTLACGSRINLTVTNSANAVRTGEMVKMGEGALQIASASGIAGLRPVPAALQGGAPFTVMGWFHLGTLADTPNNAFFYMGDCANSMNKASVRCLLSNSKTTILFGATSGAGLSIESAESRWIHVALVYTPASGSTAARVKLYSDGGEAQYNYTTRQNHNETPDGISLTEATDVFVIGGAYYANNGRYLGNGNVVDDVRVFSRELTAEEIAWFRENDRAEPVDFSAEWRVDDGGSLDLYGASNQVVNGYGAVCADVGLTLSPTNDAYFGGTLSLMDGDLAVAAVNAATQTLAGTGTYAGKTILTSGTTMFRPAANLPGTLSNGLIGYWTFDDPLDPGHDLSGMGNNMIATTNVLFDTVPSEVAGGGRALDFSLWEDSSTTYFVGTTGNPIGLVKANDYGCAVTMAVWVQLRLPQSFTRNGIAAFTDTCGFGMSIENSSSAKAFTFGGRDVGGASGCTLADSDNDITNTVHLFVATFDPLLAADDNERASAGKFYFDGVKKSEWGSKIDFSKISSRWVGRGRFVLGLGVYSQGKNMNAIYDQAMLFNRALTADEVSALVQFGQHGTPSAATGLLPGGTELSIGAAATAVFENANETVAGLSGSGELEIDGTAQLSVTNSFSFTGTVKGSGRLVLGDELTFVLPQGGDGTFNIVTAPSGVLQLPASLAAWTVEGADARDVAVFFRLVEDAQAGTETLVVSIFTRGTMIIFR